MRPTPPHRAPRRAGSCRAALCTPDPVSNLSQHLVGWISAIRAIFGVRSPGERTGRGPESNVVVTRRTSNPGGGARPSVRHGSERRVSRNCLAGLSSVLTCNIRGAGVHGTSLQDPVTGMVTPIHSARFSTTSDSASTFIFVSESYTRSVRLSFTGWASFVSRTTVQRLPHAPFGMTKSIAS